MGNEDGNDNLEAAEVPSVFSDDDLSCEVHPSSDKIIVFLLGAITSVNELARHVSILAETMPSGDSVEVLVGVLVGLIHDFLEVCLPRHIATLVEDFKVTVEGGVQDGEILVNPRERPVGKGDVESGVARFRGPCGVHGDLIGRCDSEVPLSSPKNADSGIIVCLGPGQMWFGGVLPGKCDGACSVRYSSIKSNQRRIRQDREENRGNNYRNNSSARSPLSGPDLSYPRRSKWSSDQGSGAGVCRLCATHIRIPMSRPTPIARRRRANLHAFLGCKVQAARGSSSLTEF